MCFSPEADFTAGVVVAGVGVETLRRVGAPRELIVGALPLLFGIHQLVEGFVWLGLRGQVSRARCIDYTTHTPNDVLIGAIYVVVTCGPALLSSRRYLRWFGLVCLIGVIVTALVRVDELTSLWCLYVALVSVLILEHFRRQRANETRAAPIAPPVLPPQPR